MKRGIYNLKNYYHKIRQNFDALASSYDNEFGENKIFQLMRETDLAILKKTFKPGDNVLEIGCGTGNDAIELARVGINIVATDISQKMLKITGKKAKHLGIRNLKTLHFSTKNIGLLEKIYGKGYFNGAFSSFGALNCEPDLKRVNTALAKIIKPGGHFICSVMNKYPLNEILPNLVLLRFARAFQRLNSPALAPISKDSKIKTYYYSCKEFIRSFPNFNLEDTSTLFTFVPPPHMDDFMTNKKRLLSTLHYLDRHLAHLWPFNQLGDHFLMKFRKW